MNLHDIGRRRNQTLPEWVNQYFADPFVTWTVDQARQRENITAQDIHRAADIMRNNLREMGDTLVVSVEGRVTERNINDVVNEAVQMMLRRHQNGSYWRWEVLPHQPEAADPLTARADPNRRVVRFRWLEPRPYRDFARNTPF